MNSTNIFTSTTANHNTFRRLDTIERVQCSLYFPFHSILRDSFHLFYKKNAQFSFLFYTQKRTSVKNHNFIINLVLKENVNNAFFVPPQLFFFSFLCKPKLLGACLCIFFLPFHTKVIPHFYFIFVVSSKNKSQKCDIL